MTINCSPTEPINSLTLSVDVSCTEAWLNIKAGNVSLPKKLEITRNGETALNITLSANDTTIYNDGLLPNKNYTYQAVLSNNQNSVSSNRVSVITLDTTSHNFSWQLFTLGDISTGSPSELRDVVIVNDTLAYAVGEIYVNDANGQTETQPYNLAKWNGKNWSYKRLYYKDKDYLGNDFIMVLSSIKSITVFSENNIWFAVGSVFHWNGIDSIVDFSYKILTSTGLLPGINSLWGNSNSNLYGIGNSGSIIHYSNSNWKKIESGTLYSLYDIFSNDGKTIYAAGGSFSNYNGVVVKGNSNGFSIFKEGRSINNEQLFDPYFAGIANTVWVSNSNMLYFGGNLLYRCKDNYFDFVKSLPGNYLGGNVNGEYWGAISKVRGNGENDIIMVGEGNTIRHFNGSTWQQLGMPYDYSSNYTWLAVSMKNNSIITVGRFGRQAIIMVLKR